MKTKKSQAPIYMQGRRCRVLEATLAELRRLVPPAMPVVIVIKRLDRHTLGHCERQETRFVIELNELMSEAHAIDTLLHEWAHALAWNLALDKLSQSAAYGTEEFEYAAHDEAWGCAYARVYRAHVTKILPLTLKVEQETATRKKKAGA